MADVIAGNTQICLASLIQVIPHVDSKRLKLLGIGGAKRAKVYPNVPTIAEAAFPATTRATWWGVLAPAKTPPAIVKRLHTEIDAILAHARDPEAIRRPGRRDREDVARRVRQAHQDRNGEVVEGGEGGGDQGE